MSDRETADEVRRWLRYATGDLAAAERHMVDDEPRHVCWFAQQAAEKALKAVLIWLEQRYPFTHDLDALRDLIPRDWLIGQEHPDLSVLTAWALWSRYPTEEPDPTDADAQTAVRQARAVLDSVLRDLSSHGFDPKEPT